MPRSKKQVKMVVNRLKRQVDTAARAVRKAQKAKKLRAVREIKARLTNLG